MLTLCFLEISPSCPRDNAARVKRQVDANEENIILNIENGVATCPAGSLNPVTGNIFHGTVCELTCDEGCEPVGTVICFPDNSGTWSEFACGK